MEIRNAPDPKEVTTFRFVQMRKIQIADQQISVSDQVSKGTTQALAVGNKSEFLFAGVQNGIFFTKLSHFEEIDSAVKDKELRRAPARIEEGHRVLVTLPATPSHLAISNDDLTLCVVLHIDSHAKIFLYDTRSFLVHKATPEKILPFSQIQCLSGPGIFVRDLQWNPVISNLLAITFSNNSLALYGVSDGNKDHECWTLSPGEGITCISWSPKGKQLVAGRVNGNLTQYKPDLKEAKSISGPAKELSAISILWVSTYQFLVGYENKADDGSRPGLYFVQSGKTGPAVFTFFDDICFSTGSGRLSNFFAIPILDWGIICVASANSIELGVLGSEDKDQLQWAHWTQPDEGRAEIPLNSQKTEQYPLGVAVSFTGQQRQIGELPLEIPMPVVFILAPDGILYGFYALNQSANVAQVTKPIEEISLGGMKNKVVPMPQPLTSLSSQATKPRPEPSIKPLKVEENAAQGLSMQKPNPKPAFKEPTFSKKETVKPTSNQDLRIQAKEDACGLALSEEIKAFEVEMKEFKSRMASLDLKIGSELEKEQLKAGVEKTEQFLSDLKEISVAQSKEVDATEKSTLELYTWVEETKARQIKVRDPRYRQIMKNRSLDHVSKRRIDTLNSMVSKIDQQLNQVNQTLDLEWEKHVSKVKSKSDGSNSKEIIYKTILNHRNIFDGEKRAVDSLTKSIRALKLNGPVSETFPIKGSIDNELADLTQSFNESFRLMNSSQIKNASDTRETTRAKPAGVVTMTSFSPEKQSALKNFLVTKGTTKVRPIKSEAIDELVLLKLIKPEKENKEPKSQILLNRLAEREGKDLKEKKPSTPFQEFGLKTEESFRPTFRGPTLPDFRSSNTPISSSSTVTPFSFSLPSEQKIGKPVTQQGFQSSPKEITPTKPFVNFGPAITPTKPTPGAPLFSFQTVFKNESENQTTEDQPTKTSPAGFFENLVKGQAFSIPKVAPPQFSKPSGGFAFNFPTSPTSSETSQTKEKTLPSPPRQTEKPPGTGSELNVSRTFSTGPSVSVTPIKASGAASSEKSTLASSGEEKKDIDPAALNEGSSSKTSSPIVSASVTSSSSPASTANSGSPSTVTREGILSTPSTKKVGSKAAEDLEQLTTPGSSASSSKAAETLKSAAEVSSPSAPRSSPQTTSTLTIGSKASTEEKGTASGTFSVPQQKLESSSSFSFTNNPASSVGSPSTSGGSGATTSASIFGTGSPASSSTSVFGAGPPSSTQKSIFGGLSSGFASPASIFGGSPQAPATTAGVFGGSSQASSTASRAFGGSSHASSTASSIFGGPPHASTGASSIFGGSSPTPATASSLFGGSSPAPATVSSAFGGSSQAPATASGIFGKSSQPPATASGIFGGPPLATSAPSIFGAPTQATSAAATAFGGSARLATTASASGIFGGASPEPATGSNPFGGASSLFGGPSPASTASVFGGPPTSAAGIFGGAQTATTLSVFGGGSIATTTSASPFGGSGLASKSAAPAAPPQGNFGSGTSITSTPSFGSNSGSFGASGGASIFGGASAFGGQSAGGSIFGSPASGQPAAEKSWGTGSVFGGHSSDAPGAGAFGSGGFFSGLGSTPSQEKSTKNAFGSATFGTPTSTGQSLFGNTSTTPFGGTSAFGSALSASASTGPGPFGSPAPSSPPATGFGASGPSNTFGGASGPFSTFGGAPVFGSSPTFGGNPTFGGGLGGFGRGPTLASGFGASSQVFGSGTSSSTELPTFSSVSGRPAFGSSSAEPPSFGNPNAPPTFGSPSNQGAPSFGSFGQPTGSAQAPAFGSSTAGSSFNTWR